MCVEKSYDDPEWTNELALQLIDDYEKFPVLWDAKGPHNFSKNKKADAWEAISLNMRVDMPQCIQKMNSLLGSFRREKKEGKKSIGTGKGMYFFLYNTTITFIYCILLLYLLSFFYSKYNFGDKYL